MALLLLGVVVLVLGVDLRSDRAVSGTNGKWKPWKMDRGNPWNCPHLPPRQRDREIERLVISHRGKGTVVT